MIKYLQYSLIFLPLFFTSCILVDIKKNITDIKQDIKKQSNIATLDVRVELSTEKDPDIFVILASRWGESFSVINYNILKKQNKITFYVEPDEYKIFAFEDSNNDHNFSEGEYIAFSDDLHIESQDEVNVTLTLREVRNSDEYYKNNFNISLDNSSAYLGEIISLSSPVFSEENVSKGLWKPFEFAREVPFGIFLLDKYDPNKEPVLFVHGISGSPEHFSYLIKNLDYSKIQPFVAYYPSGFSASMISNNLANNISKLSYELGFKKISIVAHSLGGVISRDILNNLNRNKLDIVDKFISISAPYGGNMMAGLGVKHSPLVVPIWKDLDPKSDFLNQLFSTPLDQNIDFYLLFGIKGMNSSDGTISIESQLDYKAQDEAKQIRGFNESHRSILESYKVSNIINKYLDK